MLTILGESCHNGPCPTLHRDTVTGEVKVQGYVTPQDGMNIPSGEGVVAIPADAWARLLADLPMSMLLRALVAPWRFRRRARRSTATPAPASR
jgi:hypothetical protein